MNPHRPPENYFFKVCSPLESKHLLDLWAAYFNTELPAISFELQKCFHHGVPNLEDMYGYKGKDLEELAKSYDLHLRNLIQGEMEMLVFLNCKFGTRKEILDTFLKASLSS